MTNTTANTPQPAARRNSAHQHVRNDSDPQRIRSIYNRLWKEYYYRSARPIRSRIDSACDLAEVKQLHVTDECLLQLCEELKASNPVTNLTIQNYVAGQLFERSCLDVLEKFPQQDDGSDECKRCRVDIELASACLAAWHQHQLKCSTWACDTTRGKDSGAVPMSSLKLATGASMTAVPKCAWRCLKLRGPANEVNQPSRPS
ncbi:hypothetical protein G8764_03480 [Pseudomaricurvus alcaniphilus]|uniref:hypothetical protein n=1 Tax=Pseudomaricurvus alcaniphilus TaxID=1166482 RepID=UPI00140C764E|nr:hypothetical protein [Pseudomaricurvus alcaniphilus]NHN36348.1 hypothetical protein [Pseudomaricurvus alcaniphilus]